MAGGERGKVQVEDCMSGLYHKSLGELEKPAGVLARMMIGASSKYQIVMTPGQAL